MKKLFTLFVASFALISGICQATETVSISILLDPAFEAKICPSPVFKDTAIAWTGTKDERSSQAVSVMYKKDQEHMSFVTDKPLAEYFDQHLKTVLKRCGMNLVNASQPHELSLSAHIAGFGANMDKTLTKSQTEAESRLTLNFDSDYTNADVSVAYMMDSKSASFKNKKKMQKMLSDLFFGTLNELIQSDQLKFLKK